MAKEPASVSEFSFVNDSEMGVLIRSFDWTTTPVGAVEGWSPSLRTAISICLESAFGMLICWGTELVQFYNDAYVPMLGSKHPKALGQRMSDCWPEAWETVEPLIGRVYNTGKAVKSVDMRFIIRRYGYDEETYFSFSYSPLRDEGGEIGGILCTVTETTERVLGERRLHTLRELAVNTTKVRTVQGAGQVAIDTLASNRADIPFALLYLLNSQQTFAQQVSETGLAADSPLNLATVDCRQDVAGVWAFAQVMQTMQPQFVSNLRDDFGLDAEAQPELPNTGLILPIAAQTQEGITGFLVVGLGPYLALNSEYRGFLELVAGQVATAIANARAYEEERERVEALAELDRAKTTFFSNVSHEFRTPLTLMLSPLEETLTELEGILPAKARSQLEMVQRNATRLLKLVNTLLDFSRIEAGRTIAYYEPTDLATYTAELASIFRSAVEQAGLQLTVDCPPLPEPVYVDREMWEKIVLNLLSNAFKFTFEGEIAVSVSSVGDQVELVVRDTGTGIPADEIPRLFERFHRVAGARGRTLEGTGIGLSLVQELVQLHGGAIAVDSTLGQGSSFTVRLPTGTAHLPLECLNATRTQTSTASGAISYVEEALGWLPKEEGEQETLLCAPLPPRPSVRILLVDDNADMRGYLHRILNQFYEVEVVADSETALASIHTCTPDLVLSDVMMPGMDGFELLRQLRASPKTREIPILLLSARAGEESAVEGLQTGADDYLIKPFSTRELLARVAANLELGRSRRESAHRQIQLYADVVRNTQVGIVVWQLEDLNDPSSFRLLIANPAASEVTGVDFESLIGTTMAQNFSMLLQTPLVQHYITVVQTGEPLDLGEVSYSDDGVTAGIYSLKAFALPNQCLGLSFENITARKQIEAQLQQSLHYSQQIIEAMPGILFVHDLIEQRNVYTSRQITDLLGYTSEQLQVMGTDVLARIIHPDDIPHLSAYLETFRTATDGMVRTIEYRAYHANGEYRWFNSQSVVFNRTAEGVPRQILGVSIDISDRKQAETELCQSEERLSLATSGAGMGTWDANLQTGRAIWNEQHFRLLGYEPVLSGEATIELWDSRLHPEDLDRTMQAIEQAQQNQTLYRCEHRIIRADNGQVVWLDEFGQFFYNDAGQAIRLVGVSFDISERKRAELALRESEERLRRAIAIETVGVIFFKTDGGITDANEAFLCMSGYSREDLEQGRVRWDKMTPPEWMPHSVRAVEEFISKGYTTPYEKEYIRKDGSRWWALFAATRLNAEEGVEFITDITDRKQAQEASRRSEERYRTLFESIDEGFCVIEMLYDENDTPLDYRFLEINPAFEKQTGLEQAEGKTARQLVPNLEDHWVEIYGKVALTGESLRFENHSEAMNRWFDVYAFRVGQPESRKVAVLFKDVSDRKRIEAEREQILQREQTAREAAENANRIKDEFLAVLSHELRSPLNPILGWTSLLRNGRLDAAKTAFALETIQRNAKLQVQLIEDLLDISRILRGKLSLNVMPVDLGAVISASLETVRLAAVAKSLKIQTTLSPTIGTISADAGRLQQVVWNLLSNAVKFTPQGGKITVTLTQTETHAQIQVSDTGIGINPNFLPYVFEHFRQEDAATTRKFGGLGLGLAIARQIVELHGGTIQAESPGEGKGATFTVNLPLPRNEHRGTKDEQTAVSLTPRALPLSNVRVLVVDDEVDTRELIAFILKQAGAIVTSVPSALAALDVLARFKPDVLVSDIGMPEMDGYMLMQQVQPMLQGKQIVAIALTAYAGEIDRHQALAAGFQQHLSKPIEPKILVQTIATLVQKDE